MLSYPINKMKELAISPRTHLAALESLIYYVLICTVGAWFLDFEYFIVIISLLTISIDAFGALSLHVPYFLKNRGERYILKGDELIREKNGVKTVYRNDDMERIELNLSPALARNSSFHIFSIESYHFARIKLKTGEELILTCLLSPRIDKVLKEMRGVSMEKKKRIYCSLY